MNICDQVSAAIAAFLVTQSPPGDARVTKGISADLNAEVETRIVVIGQDSNLRKPSLPGLYDVSGEVAVLQSVDAENAEASFESLCLWVQESIGGKYGMPDFIMGIDPDLHVYSWQFIGSSLAASERKFLASYKWTAFARNHSLTTI